MAMQNQLSKEQKKPSFSVFMSSPAVVSRINSTIGGKDGQRFITAITSAVSTNPSLQECESNSIISAAMLGESLKLSPSPQLGQYYMVPFNNSKTGGKVAQFQLGYKGYIQLAIRSGQYKKLNVLAIKEGELINYDPLNEEIEVRLIDDELAREQASTVGYYAMFEYTNGFRKTLYWSKQKMLNHADKFSQAFSANANTITTKSGKKYNKVSFEDFEAGNYPQSDEWMYSSFWYKDFDGMAFKTMLRQLISKWGIMSIEMETAFKNDMGAIKEDGSVEYVDSKESVFDTSNVVAEAKEVTTEDAELVIVEDDPMA